MFYLLSNYQFQIYQSQSYRSMNRWQKGVSNWIFWSSTTICNFIFESVKSSLIEHCKEAKVLKKGQWQNVSDTDSAATTTTTAATAATTVYSNSSNNGLIQLGSKNKIVHLCAWTAEVLFPGKKRKQNWTKKSQSNFVTILTLHWQTQS